MFGIFIIFLTEESVWVDGAELPGRIVLPQGSDWASGIFQKLAGRGRSGKTYLEPEALKTVVRIMDRSSRL